MSERSDKQLLLDMLEAIERAIRYTSGMTLEQFAKDELVCDAVMRNIQIIGILHRLVHDYFEIEEGIVWSVVANYLPPLAEELKKVLASGVE